MILHKRDPSQQSGAYQELSSAAHATPFHSCGTCNMLVMQHSAASCCLRYMSQNINLSHIIQQQPAA